MEKDTKAINKLALYKPKPYLLQSYALIKELGLRKASILSFIIGWAKAERKNCVVIKKSTFAEQLQLSEKTVYNLLQELHNDGYITKNHGMGRNNN